ncbi:hypothetical protein [Nostoc favosum]|uniref:Uncharacterized protein n=1 Tax=Nostoc favosum CHAB5714 TaxID=2780399 RepID=A0ABS8I504_9NOSO|nr:hypothetical protein [Nostoc favosum]MCC5599132.1 hypothetical protein [Nostoc favosum CHAB5714]
MRENAASLGQSPATLFTPVDASVDIDSIRDRTLNQLKMGRQSPAGKAIQAFIKELKHAL